MPLLPVNDPISTPPRGPRLGWIEHLRGLAVLLVLAQHIFANALPRMEVWLNLGLCGVVIFFLVSGFVIPYSAFGLSRRPALVFPIARVFRLYPVYWLSVALGAALLHPAGRALLLSLTMMQRLVGGHDLLGVYWTLEVELLFYALIELLLLSRRLLTFQLYPWLAALFTALTLLMGFMRDHLHRRTPMAPPAGLAIMFLGTCFFLHRRHGFLTRGQLIALGLAMYAVLAAAFVLGYRQDWGFDEHPLPFLISYLLAAVCFFSFALLNHKTQPLLTFIGRISYPIYLFHVPLLDLMPRLLPHSSAWTTLPLALAAIFAVATLLHYTVEDPMIRLGKKLIRHVVT